MSSANPARAERFGGLKVACVAAAVVVAAAWAPLLPESTSAEGRKIRGLDVAAVFPSTTTALIEFDGRPWHAHGAELWTSRVLKTPEMQEFLGPALQLAEGAFQVAITQADAPIDLTGALDVLANSRTTFGLTRFETKTVNKGDFATEETSLDFMLAMNFPEGRAASLSEMLKGLVAALRKEGAGPAPRDVKIGGVDAVTIPLQQGDEFQPFSQATYLLLDDWLLVGTNDGQLEQAVGRVKANAIEDSLASNAVYAKCAKETLRPKSFFSCYVNFKEILERVKTAQYGPEVEKALAGTGVDQMDALAFASELDGVAVKERFYAHGYKTSPVVSGARLNELHALLPKSSSYAASMAYDWSAAYDLVLAMLASEHGDASQKRIAQFEKRYEFDLRKDFLSAFGPELGMYAVLPRYGVVPDVGLVLRAADVQKAEAALKKALSIGGVRETTEVVHRGRTIHVVDTSSFGWEIDGAPFAPRPSYCFVDGGFVVLTLWPQAAKNFLDGVARNDGGFALNADAAEAFRRIKSDVPNAGGSGMIYADLRGFAGFVIDTATPVVQSMVPTTEGFPIDVAKMPTTAIFTDGLPPMLVTTQLVEGGVSSISSSPIGFFPTYLMLGGAAVGVLVARQEMHAIGETRVVAPSAPRGEGEDGDEDR
jgi:hypothetical protein